LYSFVENGTVNLFVAQWFWSCLSLSSLHLIPTEIFESFLAPRSSTVIDSSVVKKSCLVEGRARRFSLAKKMEQMLCENSVRMRNYLIVDELLVLLPVFVYQSYCRLGQSCQN